MLSLADHANHEGGNIWPSHELTAWKTGYTKRHVRRVVKSLRLKGILVVEKEATWNRPTTYAIDWGRARPKGEFVPTDDPSENPGGDVMSSQPSEKGDMNVPPTTRGVTQMSPEPSYKEKDSNESSKKEVSLSPSNGKKKKLSTEEATRLWEDLVSSDPHGRHLEALAEIMAEKNQSGEVAITRVWRELGIGYRDARARNPDLSEEAWDYGFHAAVSKEAPNIRYAQSAAKNFTPGKPAKPNMSGRTKRNQKLVVDQDYDD